MASGENIKGDILSKPCRVTEVELKGLKQTRPEFIERQLTGVRKAVSLEELYEELQNLLPDLSDLDIFTDINVVITETRRKEPGTCRLEMHFEEKGFWSAKAKTFVQRTEAGIEGRVGLRNLRGLGERLTFFTEFGSHGMMESALEYSIPKFLNSSSTFHAKVFNYMKSNAYYSSWEERLKAMSLGLTSSGRLHSLTYDFGWQQILDSSHLASLPIQHQLGHRLVSSLNYQFLYDPRASRQLSTGCAFRWRSQLNGLIPSAEMTKTFKSRMDLQLSWKFLPWSSFAIGAGAGAVVPLRRDFQNHISTLTERFYLGGVDSIKGFHTNRIGPTALCRNKNATHPTTQRDALGGDVVASAYASLNFFQRGIPEGQLGIYARIFGDIGNVAPLSTFDDGPFKENLRKFALDYRASVGLGIVLPTPVGNFEVNYVLPMRYGTHDSIRSGIQMSFGTEPFTA